jgi:alpha-1,3-rhamnosyl/mannosyltransferase
VSAAGGRDARRARADLAHYTDGLAPLFSGVRLSVLTVHDLSIVRHWRAHAGRRLPRIPLVLLAPHRVTRVIADSRATADEVMRLCRIRASQIDVVPLAPRSRPTPTAAEVGSVLDRMGLDRGGYILLPGTVEPRKNHIRAIAAFEQLVARNAIPQDVRLVIAGASGWGSRPIIERVAESPSHARIKNLGYVSDEELVALMTGAALVAYVSIYEGFGLPVLEAMACGAPVVTSNVSSMPEAAGDAAVLVDPFDEGAIASGIEDAWRGQAEMRQRSVERAAAFSWARTAVQTVEVYRRVAA